MIEVQDLKKNYNGVEALKGVTFFIKEGSFFALLGPNGAGKSTTVNIISTLLMQNTGKVTIDGSDTINESDLARKKIGVVFQHSTLDDSLTVEENLIFRASLYGLSKTTIQKRIDYLSELLDFKSYLSQRIKTLSGGQKRKIDVARALIFDPKYLILDEPTTGLDPSVRKQIWTFVNTIRKTTQTTIILTTHYMEEVIDCDHVVIIDKGKVIAEDSAENLRKTYTKDFLKITPKNDFSKVKFEKLPNAKSVNALIYLPIDNPFKGIDFVQTHQENIETFEIVKGSMDDVFLHLTGRELTP